MRFPVAFRPAPLALLLVFSAALAQGIAKEPKGLRVSNARLPSLTSFEGLGPGGGGSVFSVVIHNTDPDIILAGQDVGGVMKSTDGGTSWRHVNQGGISGTDRTLGVYGIPALFAHPARDDVFFAASWEGLFRSVDAGDHWSRVASSVEPFDALAVSPANPDVVVAATGDWHFADSAGSGLYRSMDGGASFAQIAATPLSSDAQYANLAFDPADGSLWAATSEGLFRSTNLGNSFTKVPGPFAHDRGLWIGITGSSPGTQTFWYVLETLGQEEDGSDWDGGYYRSTNGSTWVKIPDPPILAPLCEDIMRPTGVRFDPSDPDILYAALRSDGFCGGFYRYDGTWTNLFEALGNPTHTNPFMQSNPHNAAISRSNPNRIVVGDDPSIYLSDDRGATFRAVSVTEPSPGIWAGTGAEVTYAYELDSAAGVLFAAFEDIGAWRSDDRGHSWRQLTWHENSSELDAASGIDVHPTNPNRLYVALSSWSNGLREADSTAEIVKSTDGGTTVTKITPSARGTRGRAAMAVVWGDSPSTDTLYVAFHGSSLYRSSDGGSSWSEIRTGFAGRDYEMVFRLTINPANTNQIWAGLNTAFGEYGSQGGLYRSDNGGTSWMRVNGFPWQDVATIGFEGTPKRLFVGGWTYSIDDDLANGGLEVSDDGATFSRVLDQPFVHDIAEQPGAPGSLFVASSATYAHGSGQDAGIWFSQDNGATCAKIDIELPHAGVHDLHFMDDQPGRLLMATVGDGIIAANVSAAEKNRRRPVRRR